jgi:hypothetical protein
MGASVTTIIYYWATAVDQQQYGNVNKKNLPSRIWFIGLVYVFIPKLKQTLFGNRDSPYGNIRVSLPISVR